MSDEIEWLRRWAGDTDPERDPITPAEVRTAPPPALGAVETAHRVVRGPRLLLVAAVVLTIVCIATVTVAAQGGGGDGVVRSGGPSTTEGSETTGTTEAPTTVPSTTSTVPTTPITPAPMPPPASTTTSWVGIGLRETPVFAEGFDYGARVLRNGDVVAERALADFSGDGGQHPTMWTSFEVSPGPAIVESDLNVGDGVGPTPVDFADACPLAVDVPEEGGVLLQLNWQTGCLEPLAAADLPPFSEGPTVPVVAAPGPPGSDPAPTDPSGAFDGREEFALFTGRCAFLDHRLDATFTLADGARWAFRSTYCGEIDAQNRHHADGEFTFTTADGSTLAGTFQSEAQLPSTGAPYTLQIEQGSGTYAGARGQCSIDNHLETVQFGRQRQYGTFSCTLVVDRTPGSDVATPGPGTVTG